MKEILFSGGKKMVALHEQGGMYGHKEGPNKFGDVAFAPGTGPADYCKNCVHVRHNKSAHIWGRCAKAAELRRVNLGSLSLIPLMTVACKYFGLRSKDMPKPWDRIDRNQPEEPKAPEMF